MHAFKVIAERARSSESCRSTVNTSLLIIFFSTHGALLLNAVAVLQVSAVVDKSATRVPVAIAMTARDLHRRRDPTAANNFTTVEVPAILKAAWNWLIAQCHVRSCGPRGPAQCLRQEAVAPSPGSGAAGCLAVRRIGFCPRFTEVETAHVTPVAKTCWPPPEAALTQHGCSAAADLAGTAPHQNSRLLELLASRPSWSCIVRSAVRDMASILQTATSRRNEVGTIGATEPHVRGMPGK